MISQQPTKKDLLTLTPAAAQQVSKLLAKRAAAGIRIGVRQRGCSGNAYTLEYADAKGPLDEVVTSQDITIFIDPKAVLFVIGTEMDYVESKLESGFTFKNPNEKGRCGCGESFHV